MRKLWFRAKEYGWGWYPAAWQGWLITLIYTILVLLLALTIDEDSSAKEVFFTLILPITFLTITFIRIAYKTGEKPSWRWGNKK